MLLRKYITIIFLISCSAIASNTYATVVIPKILGNGMVLQRNKPVPIWGTATVGENITVKFNNQVKKTTADALGKWEVTLDPMSASATPQVLEISGTNTIKLDNILVGEVWLCSGQSNMSYEMRKNSKVRRPDSTTVNTPIDELDKAHNPQIRIFLVTQHNLRTPDSTHSGWDVAEGTALRNFSAAGYFFAKNLNHDLHVPVGIICSAISGSRIEPWMPAEAFDAIPYFKQNNVKVDGDPGKLYVNMIAPVAPYAVRGFLWYQGESGAYLGETISYTYKMEALINWWRQIWGDKDLPFYYVQIAPFYYSRAKSNVTYSIYTEPEFREAQTMALKIPHTGMIVTTDLNDSLTNIHPAFKWVVGRRLELQALANTYGKKNVVFSGPMYQSMQIKGNKIILDFKYVGDGLVSHDGKPLNYFTIAGSDGKFITAKAVIEGNKVIVSSPEVPHPVAARFAWTEVAEPNFYNKNGLPAVPFRTDNPLNFKLTVN